MKSPFPYFGAKSTVAHLVWEGLGDVKHYIEPFFGSGAVLLNRPDYTNEKHIETVCDKDGFLANVFRSLQFNPDEVAKWCDWPVDHANLNARKLKLISHENYLLENLIKNDEWCDPKLAGYWIWAASCWIGAGLTRVNQIPQISHGGKGIHALGQIPHVGTGGMGVHKLSKRQAINGSDKNVQEPYNTNLYKWFRELSERLRYVRVVCGDWTRVCGGNWQDNNGTVGIFFDPPYGVKDRNTAVYYHDSTTVAKDVMAWCIERGSKESYRIVLAGYNEYEELSKYGWRSVHWKSHGGYANVSKKEGTQGKLNRNRETLWFSPHCIKTELLLDIPKNAVVLK